MKCLQKPNEGFYLDLYEALLLPDCVSRSSYFQSQFRRDFATIKSRSLSSEGFQFCTKTIPKLGKAFDAGLIEGQFHCPLEFKRLKGKSIPVFLQGCFALVFDCDRGILLPRPSEWAVKHIREVCFWYYKLELDYSQKEKEKIITSFRTVDEELGQSELIRRIDESLDVRIASEITGGTIYDSTPVGVFSSFNPKDIIPRHGPGAVATGERGE
jgi:hypothetical protein